jgi:hypothetical protein
MVKRPTTNLIAGTNDREVWRSMTDMTIATSMGT